LSRTGALKSDQPLHPRCKSIADSQRKLLKQTRPPITRGRVGEAAGPIIAGFLIGGLGYATTFDVLAAATAAAAVGLMALVPDPKKAEVDRAL
jgi:hypothetical protein